MWWKINFFISLLIQYCIAIEISSVGNDFCELPLPKLSFFAPLVFTEDGTLKGTQTTEPDDNTIIKVGVGENVILSCSPNFLINYSVKTKIIGTCKRGSVLDVNGEEKNFVQKLGCEIRAIEEILTPIDGCLTTNPNNELTSIEYGFTHPVNEKSYVLGESCYSETNGKTYFIHSKYWPHSQNSINDLNNIAVRQMENKNYFRQKHPMSRYKLDFLRSARLDTLNDRLSDMLGTEKVPELNYGNLLGSNLLMNQQFYSAFKLGWNYVMFNGETTAKLWSKIRPQLKTKEVANLYVGTHGVAKKVNNVGKLIPLYLTEDNRFPVVEYLWMLLIQGNRAIVLIVLNDDLPRSENQVLCQSQCHRVRFIDQPLVSQAMVDGRIQCCEYKDVKKNIEEMPSMNRVFELLFE